MDTIEVELAVQMRVQHLRATALEFLGRGMADQFNAWNEVAEKLELEWAQIKEKIG